jgi:hypothetical protein
MWELRRLTTLLASTAYYRYIFTFLFLPDTHTTPHFSVPCRPALSTAPPPPHTLKLPLLAMSTKWQLSELISSKQRQQFESRTMKPHRDAVYWDSECMLMLICSKPWSDLEKTLLFTKQGPPVRKQWGSDLDTVTDKTSITRQRLVKDHCYATAR